MRVLPFDRRRRDRRAFPRGGRRDEDWKSLHADGVKCPRCHSPEVKFVDATPSTAYWQCHGCRHHFSTTTA